MWVRVPLGAPFKNMGEFPHCVGEFTHYGANVLLAICFGIATALSNAVALLTQHLPQIPTDHHRSRGATFVYLARQPLWLIGWLALAGSLLCQSVALHFGPLSVVQPLLVTELVMALLLRRLWRRQRLSRRAWISAAVTTLSLAAFLVLANPSGAQEPRHSLWLATGSVTGTVIVACMVIGRRGSPTRRAASFAVATALSWAFEATLIKQLGDQWTQHGVVGVLSNWVLYVFVAVGLVGLFSEQTALQAGPLGVSQPLIVIVDPLASMALGATLFAERFHGSGITSTAALVALVITGVSALVLMRATPEVVRITHR